MFRSKFRGFMIEAIKFGVFCYGSYEILKNINDLLSSRKVESCSWNRNKVNVRIY